MTPAHRAKAQYNDLDTFGSLITLLKELNILTSSADGADAKDIDRKFDEIAHKATRLAGSYRVGERRITLMRDGKTIEVTLKVAVNPMDYTL